MHNFQRSQKKYRMCVKPQRIKMNPSSSLKGRVKKKWQKKAEYFFDLNNLLIRIISLFEVIIRHWAGD